MTAPGNTELPRVLVGPLLRHVHTDRILLWLVTTSPMSWCCRVRADGQTVLDRALANSEQTEIAIGDFAYLQLLEIRADSPLPQDCLLHYDLGYKDCSVKNTGIDTIGGEDGGQKNAVHTDDGVRWISDWAAHLIHEGHQSPHLVIHSRLQRVLHGSCRKPHHPSEDALRRIDSEVGLCGSDSQARPSLLLMTGDQVYVDDVAGPMLNATHQLSDRLGLFDEVIDRATVVSGASLVVHENTYYKRSNLLPLTRENTTVIERFFGGARKPIFTTANAENHLVTLAEVLAMYMLVWSPVPWTLIDIVEPVLTEPLLERYRSEKELILRFVEGLSESARALCHVPCYMIFDDHDVTDDWNLSLLWEQTVYEHPFARRIIGNALMAYALCQGWGNGAGSLSELITDCQSLLNDTERRQQKLPAVQHDHLISKLLDFRGWQYTLNTNPVLVVLDTRTHRWHRRGKPSQASGLMDWEALSNFQQCILNQPAVIVVSPAPVFGVKLIEIVQRVFSFFGKPLLVDAENWMAHHEAATVILSIFEHSQTPRTFVLLSGDVHYSFAYDVRLRYQSEKPEIWQITSSGIKNEFPVLLIEWLDRLNRWLFAPWSPLNLLTQRSSFRIWPRLPVGRSAGERLWNHSGIGDVRLDGEGRPIAIRQLNSDTGGTQFEKGVREG